MRKSFKYPIYPTKSQQSRMERTLDLCRWVYNQTLAYRKDAWEKEGRSTSKYETHNLLPEWKVEKPELIEVHSQVLQNVQERVELAFKAFFRRVKSGEKPGYPRFRGLGWYDSFTYPQSGFKLSFGKLRLSKVGDVKIKLHRPIEGKIKRLTIRRTSTGKWFACFSVEIDDPPKPPWKDGSMVGIDVGLESFATLSNGEKIDNPRFFRSEEKALAKAQRRLSKCEKGTPDRMKALKVVQRIHERIANKRYYFAHQVSHNLVERFGLIAFEDLSITKMLNNHCLAKSISDAAWRMLVTIISYKAESAGSIVVLVDPRNTSQLCSRCGLKVTKSLSDRVHECPQCGLIMDRDENAAINILRLGLQSLPKARSPALQGGE
ncbi:RNA-guided endonuclease InsQ/TnpB family protein [Methanothrix harundinacea]|uniref:Transposase, IS605 OrfB family n=1 Tax=Methanothrix harundinacea (strain 6Ac) TaxID=1110509 RepID=G7WMU0_METH6|nr:RNA-guided endonuclease TnpB family protein [Methanothrix harundinacea]AET64505.1 Transposase, IS605 OrfB family [Methanothrix harundinacea 6Ac]